MPLEQREKGMGVSMNRKIRLVINITLLIIMTSITIWLITNIYEEKMIQKRSKNLEEQIQANKISSTIITDENQRTIIKEDRQENEQKINSNTKQTLEMSIPLEWKGYDVSAKLEIPSIKLETYILKNYSEHALQISVVKFWGANPNEIGNFCVVGHNYQNNHMFKNLYKLKIGDSIFVSDNKNGKLEYRVNDMYTVLPKQTNCLSQKTNGKRELTLITCTKDSKERIIIKAEN